MGLGIIAGALQGAGEAGVRAGAMLQKQFGDEDLLKMKTEADRNLALQLEDVRQRFTGAENQKSRDLTVSENQKGRDLTASEGAANRGVTTSEGEANRGQRAKEFEVRNAQDERQHQERMAGLNRQIAQQGAQISLETRKVAMLEQAGALDIKAKESIDRAREAYVSEKDPDRKIELGNTYMTLLGKTGERYKAIEQVDPITGAKTITGFIDQSSGRVLGPNGKNGAAASQPTAEDIAGLKARARNPAAIEYFESKHGRGSAQKYLQSGGGNTGDAQFKDPLNGEMISASEWKRKYGEMPKRTETEMRPG